MRVGSGKGGRGGAVLHIRELRADMRTSYIIRYRDALPRPV